jgi:hypothetical protein
MQAYVGSDGMLHLWLAEEEVEFAFLTSVFVSITSVKIRTL